MNNSDLTEKLTTAYKSLTETTKEVLREANEQLSARFAEQSTFSTTKAYLILIKTIGEELQTSDMAGLEQKLISAYNVIKNSTKNAPLEISSSQNTSDETLGKKMIHYEKAISLWMDKDKDGGRKVVTRAAYSCRLKSANKNKRLEIQREKGRIYLVDEVGLLREIEEYSSCHNVGRPKKGSGAPTISKQPASLDFVDSAILKSDRVKPSEPKDSLIATSHVIAYCAKFEQDAGLKPRSNHAYGEWLRRFIKEPLNKIRLVANNGKYDLDKSDLDHELNIYIERKKSMASTTIASGNTPQPNKADRKKTWSAIKERLDKGDTPEEAFSALKINDGKTRFGYSLAIKRYFPLIKHSEGSN